MQDFEPRKLHLDMVAVFAGYLVVEGQCAAEDVVSMVSVQPSNAHAARRVTIAQCARHSRGGSPASDANGFILKIPYGEVADMLPLQQSMRWSVETEAGARAHLSGRARAIQLAQGKCDSLARWAITRAIEAGLFNGNRAALIDFDLTFLEKMPKIDAHVEAVVRTGDVVVINLWAPNAGKRNLIAFDPDLVDVADRDDILFLPQPDLNENIARSGVVVQTILHGAIISLKNYTKPNEYIVLAEISEGTIIAAQKIEIASNAPSQALFENIVKHAGNGRLPTPAIMERYIRPMISGINNNIELDNNIIADIDAKPEFSVIVAVTGGLNFIHSFIAMQMAAPSSLEWILVCDDPSLHEEALAYLVARKDALKCRTIFVCNKESYGTGRSNNIGARTARGRMLLFMASDVWIDDFALITKAAAAIDAGSSDVVGFRLTYEDGSLLHNGLHVKKSTQIHGLLVIDHPGKGFPPPEDSDNIIVVPAVPGALLLISKSKFESVAGFDEDYLVCDYEDVDLCMKVRASGKQIGLIQQGGCYQVSSDSSVTLGDLSLAGIVLYLNCLTFNRKWAVEIGQEIADRRWA